MCVPLICLDGHFVCDLDNSRTEDLIHFPSLRDARQGKVYEWSKTLETVSNPFNAVGPPSTERFSLTTSNSCEEEIRPRHVHFSLPQRSKGSKCADNSESA